MTAGLLPLPLIPGFLCLFLILPAFGKTVFAAVGVEASKLEAPIVDLGYAQYQGTLDSSSNNTHFLGMRYAAPPTGRLRWRAPQTPQNVVGVQQADAQPPQCPQGFTGVAPTNPFLSNSNRKRQTEVSSSEDCLFLNVYIPGELGTSPESFPVVVWIHGGGYVSGSATGFTGQDIYNGDDLIRESGNGVVVVVIQYRIGVFGFLPGSKVKADGDLNAGLLDQHFAFRWVQTHISKFGGDPTRVTIWGESAGAGSVFQHLIAQNGKTDPPLFRAAITSSTFLPSQYQYNDDIPETLYSEVVVQTNCSTAVDTLDCLRAVNTTILEAANVAISLGSFFGTYLFVPVIDGTFITQSPYNALKEGRVNGDTLLSITNTFEGSLFIDPSTEDTVQVSEFLAQLFPKFGPQQIEMATKQYANLGTPFFQVTAIMGESIFICPTYFLLQTFEGRSYKGEFAVPPGGHGNDIVYYFPSTNGGVLPYNNTDFDKAFSQSFLAFARSLNPNTKFDPTNITPNWLTWNQEGRAEMLFNRTDAGAPFVKPTVTSDALLERCNFWNSVGAFTGQ